MAIPLASQREEDLMAGTIQISPACAQCHGTRRVNDLNDAWAGTPCPDCKGTGEGPPQKIDIEDFARLIQRYQRGPGWTPGGSWPLGY
jgi:hypothetical protein